jgi:hypothetical protein
LCLSQSLAATAQDAGIEAARRALSDRAKFPWYDSRTDTIKPVTLPVERPPRTPSDWIWNASSQSTSRSRRGSSGFWESFQYLIWIALAALLAALAYYWIKAIARHQAGQLTDGIEVEDRLRHEADSIEQLPFQVKRPQEDLLGEARRHFQQQNYGEAIIYLFSYQLVQLDRHQRIHLAKGKTNRQYVREVSSLPRLRQLLTATMLAFEDVFFGKHELDRQRFESCWDRLEEFDALVRQKAATD